MTIRESLALHICPRHEYLASPHAARAATRMLTPCMPRTRNERSELQDSIFAVVDASTSEFARFFPAAGPVDSISSGALAQSASSTHSPTGNLTSTLRPLQSPISSSLWLHFLFRIRVSRTVYWPAWSCPSVHNGSADCPCHESVLIALAHSDAHNSMP